MAAKSCQIEHPLYSINVSFCQTSLFDAQGHTMHRAHNTLFNISLLQNIEV